MTSEHKLSRFKCTNLVQSFWTDLCETRHSSWQKLPLLYRIKIVQIDERINIGKGIYEDINQNWPAACQRPRLSRIYILMNYKSVKCSQNTVALVKSKRSRHCRDSYCTRAGGWYPCQLGIKVANLPLYFSRICYKKLDAVPHSAWIKKITIKVFSYNRAYKGFFTIKSKTAVFWLASEKVFFARCGLLFRSPK